ncbi:MAG: WcaF family extracellular polysaccharide biosynthesis acetyltransferase [Gammaproteobacteria bacterium]|nr:WcaF family extracellular polysaccharide biosynthesis acetyltransferase [Gammaproteobacteria bacterium]
MNTDSSPETPTPDLEHYRVTGYSPGGNAVSRILWYYVNALIFNSALFPIYGLKRALLRWFGAQIGKGVVIKPDVNIKYPWRLKVGDFSWIGEGVHIDNLANVAIGANACVSQEAYLLTGNHDYTAVEFTLITGEIVLEDGAWVGARSIVCPGRTMRRNAILTAGSVLTRDAEANGIYAGNPAVLVRQRLVKNHD